MTEQLSVRARVDGALWRITLDRPDPGNAVDPALTRDLLAALQGRPRDTRSVLLDASGPHFCVGGDVRGIASPTTPVPSSGSWRATGTTSSAPRRLSR